MEIWRYEDMDLWRFGDLGILEVLGMLMGLKRIKKFKGI